MASTWNEEKGRRTDFDHVLPAPDSGSAFGFDGRRAMMETVLPDTETSAAGGWQARSLLDGVKHLLQEGGGFRG